MDEEITLWECGTCGLTGRCVHCQTEIKDTNESHLENYNRTGEEVHQGPHR